MPGTGGISLKDHLISKVLKEVDFVNCDTDQHLVVAKFSE
jgi:hypothetical protein